MVAAIITITTIKITFIIKEEVYSTQQFLTVHLFSNVYSSFIYHSQELETIQMLINR